MDSHEKSGCGKSFKWEIVHGLNLLFALWKSYDIIDSTKPISLYAIYVKT